MGDPVVIPSFDKALSPDAKIFIPEEYRRRIVEFRMILRSVYQDPFADPPPFMRAMVLIDCLKGYIPEKKRLGYREIVLICEDICHRMSTWMMPYDQLTVMLATFREELQKIIVDYVAMEKEL